MKTKIMSVTFGQKKSVGQKSLWIFAPRSKTYKRRNRSNSFEISRNSPKITEQFSEIPSYFSELNASVPTSSFYFACRSLIFVSKD